MRGSAVRARRQKWREMVAFGVCPAICSSNLPSKGCTGTRVDVSCARAALADLVPVRELVAAQACVSLCNACHARLRTLLDCPIQLYSLAAVGVALWAV